MNADVSDSLQPPREIINLIDSRLSGILVFLFSISMLRFDEMSQNKRFQAISLRRLVWSINASIKAAANAIKADGLKS